MNTQNENYSSWTFERPFSFESDAPIEDVLQSLAQLEDQGGFWSRRRNDISILPTRNGYSFRYRLRWRNKSSFYTTAIVEGRVWEDQTNTVIVEGTSRIDPWRLYGSIGFLVLLMMMFGLFTKSMFLFPMIFLVIGAMTLYSYYSDRNRAIDAIGEAVANSLSLTAHFQAKQKGRPIVPKVKKTPLNVEDAPRSNSVWDDAISEFDDEAK